MSLDYATLEQLRQTHPAWRLLNSPHAPLVASFLQRVFVLPNRRVMAQADLVEALEDELFGLRERLGVSAYPKAALEYLNDWAAADKAWLRKYYVSGSDEPQFDLTPATERALSWLLSLSARSFVGTESRLLTLFELLKQMHTGSQLDPQARLSELQAQRDEIDAQMERVRKGDLTLLDDTALKERFQQFSQLSRELLSDFREVEQNFAQLDRRVRERIALWGGSKGELLADIMGERDAIAGSDQGRSFRAFWDFLMSSQRQDELSGLLREVLALPAVAALAPDARLQRVHYDWLEAGEHTQRTVALLSQQLRRFLDDKAWLENRRIMDILRSIEARAIALRDAVPTGEFMDIAGHAASIELPMERPLFRPKSRPMLNTRMLLEQGLEGDAREAWATLYSQVRVDKAVLSQRLQAALQAQAQISLGELCERHPLRQGVAELVAYLQLGVDSFKTVVDESVDEWVVWQQGAEAEGGPELALTQRRARLPRVIYVR